MSIKNLYVIKRDGREEKFDHNKITNAIIKAMTKIDRIDLLDKAYLITNEIVNIIDNSCIDKIDITDIEKIVESILMQEVPDVAREYTSYRGARDASRTRSSNLVKKIQGLLNNTDSDITAENANKDSTKIYVQRDLLAGIVAKEITGDLKLIPQRVQMYMKNNYIHWHDLDYSPLFSMYNCMLIDYRTMLEKGFIVGNVLVESPKSFGVACTLLSQIIQGVASSQYGGQTINRIDEGLKIYIDRSYLKIIKKKLFDIVSLYDDITTEKIDELFNYMQDKDIEFINNEIKKVDFLNKLNIINNVSPETKLLICNKLIELSLINIEKEVYDGIQCLEYQLNSLYSTNGQTPFVSISFGLGTSIESRMIQKSILDVRLLGIGKNKITPVFPKLLFILCSGINLNKDDPNYDIKQKAMKCASTRLYPDILNYENVCKVGKGKVYYKDEEHKIVDIKKSERFVSPMGK